MVWKLFISSDMYIEMWSNENYLYCSISIGNEDETGADSGWEWTSDWDGEWETDADTRRLRSSSSLNCGDESGVLANLAGKTVALDKDKIWFWKDFMKESRS